MLTIAKTMLNQNATFNVGKMVIQRTRTIKTSANPLNQIFKIQSQDDFEQKVKNSKTPVIVDFFAT